MEKGLRLPKDFSLDIFVDVFIRESLELVRSNKRIPLDKFDIDLRNQISGKSGVSEDVVKYLHHSFYWEFFDNGDKNILNRIQAPQNGEIGYVELSRDYNEREISELVASHLEKYVNSTNGCGKDPYLVARVKRISFQEDS